MTESPPLIADRHIGYVEKVEGGREDADCVCVCVFKDMVFQED